MKKSNYVLTVILVFGLGMLVENIYMNILMYNRHPEYYEVLSAPWYTYGILPSVVEYILLIIVCLVVRLILKWVSQNIKTV
ncbi:hypothetical protein [Butyrivibrio sp. LC3010]|uniref:hypothetical protein n=1 Tax=Butyrivibrio sp. LC3010 TaxID=1280680 RepID=UPI0004786862|nr:hypothetical protein [Butyrivibrio sp. LC3010]